MAAAVSSLAYVAVWGGVAIAMFHVVRAAHQCLLRCAYCETDLDSFVTANNRSKWYSHDRNLLSDAGEPSKEMLAFATEEGACKEGFHLRKNTRPGTARKATAAS